VQGTDACRILKNNPWVSNVSVAEQAVGDRRLLADISPDGHRLIRDLGFEEFSQRLMAVLPSPWQDEGCLLFRHLHDWLLEGRSAGERNSRPGILSLLSEPDHHRVLLDVGAELVFFQGHFPGNPILPGIAQLHWAVGAAMSLFGFREAPYEIKRLKFRNIIRPSSVIELVLDGKDKREVTFEFASSGQVHSTGCLCFKEEMPC